MQAGSLPAPPGSGGVRVVGQGVDLNQPPSISLASKSRREVAVESVSSRNQIGEGVHAKREIERASTSGQRRLDMDMEHGMESWVGHTAGQSVVVVVVESCAGRQAA